MRASFIHRHDLGNSRAGEKRTFKIFCSVVITYIPCEIQVLSGFSITKVKNQNSFQGFFFFTHLKSAFLLFVPCRGPMDTYLGVTEV